MGSFAVAGGESLLSESQFPFLPKKYLASQCYDSPSGNTLGHSFKSFSQLSCHVGLGMLSGLQARVTCGHSRWECTVVRGGAPACMKGAAECECGGRASVSPVCPLLHAASLSKHGLGLTGSWAPAPRGRAGPRCPHRHPGAGTRSGSHAWVRSAADSP